MLMFVYPNVYFFSQIGETEVYKIKKSLNDQNKYLLEPAVRWEMVDPVILQSFIMMQGYSN